MRVYAAYASAAAATLILFVVVVDPIIWGVLRTITGFCMAGIYVVSESWLNGINLNANRGRALSLYVAVQLIGAVVGQVLLANGDPSGYGLFILSTVLMSLAFGPMMLAVSPVPVFETARPMRIRELYEASPLAVVGMLIIAVALSTVFSMTSVFAAYIGLSLREIAAVVGALYIGGAIFLYPVGWASDIFGRRKTVLGLCIALAAVSITAATVAHDGLLLILAVGLVGGCVSPLYSILIAYANDRIETDRMAACGGKMIFLNGVGSMVGPVTAGLLMEKYGPLSFFYLLAASAGLLCLYTLYRIMRRAGVDEDAQTVAVAGFPGKQTAVGAAMQAEIAQDELDNK